MLVVRAAGPADIDALMELARLSGRGFTSLPEDRPTLVDRLALSAASFAGEVAPAAAWYTLLLEDADSGRVEGVSAVRAAVGLERPHFSFRIVTLAQYSRAIGTRFDHQALVLVNECSGWSEVGSLFVRAEARTGGAGSLLAAARYMLIGADPTRFSKTVMAELRGWFDDDGASPFWEGVASKFFRLPFDEADAMVTSTDGQFILDLAPRHPIYLELIDAAARAATGMVHRDGRPALAMLEREGFAPSGLIDVFDGGPTVTCPRDRIATLRAASELAARIGDGAERAAERLVSTASVAGFRAVRASVATEGDVAIIEPAAARALGIRDGSIVRIRQ